MKTMKTELNNGKFQWNIGNICEKKGRWRIKLPQSNIRCLYVCVCVWNIIIVKYTYNIRKRKKNCRGRKKLLSFLVERKSLFSLISVNVQAKQQQQPVIRFCVHQHHSTSTSSSSSFSSFRSVGLFQQSVYVYQ